MKATMLAKMLVSGLVLVVCQAGFSQAAPMGTNFTYQGRLIDANNAAEGLYDFYFWLFDSPSIFGNPVSGVILLEDVESMDGYFTAELDFGSGIFDGNDRWMQIGVRPGDSNDIYDFVPLSPRQRITATPYALYAKSGTPGPQGPVGPMGPQGHEGDKGDTGQQGIQGEQGLPGPQGAKGDKGDIGDIGPQGPIGLTGLQGPQGEQGLPGPQGAKGDKGDIGEIGPQGPIGLTGPQGPQGEQGIPGTQGPKGDKGDTGDIGPQGPIGLTGPQGLQGEQGIPGAQGAKGDKGDIGDIGPQGPIGLTGPQGLQGEQGIPGAQGPIGPAGPTLGIYDSLGLTSSGGRLAGDAGTRTLYNLGNLGIGTMSPQAMLHVNGSAVLQNGAAVSEFSTDGTLSGNSDAAVPTEKAVKTYVDAQVSTSTPGVVPIGGVVAWVKSFPNTPSLASNFAECNGQILNDPNSPYNGRTIPNLNGFGGGETQRFLRGSTTSGTTGGTEVHAHGLTSKKIRNGGDDIAADAQPGTTAVSSLPSYYEVIWIMRVK